MPLQYTNDILGVGFEQLEIPLNDDFGGKVKATLIRRLSELNSQKAVLYIHGFSDYFFQKEMADTFAQNRYNFYAIDLRRYGRSLMPGQHPCDIRDLKSYFEEIDRAINQIKSERNEVITLIGHSTGGLIATIYAKYNTAKGQFDNLILNSPFFDFNLNPKFLKKLVPFLSNIGKIFPLIKISGVLSKYYGESLHKQFNGKWDYNLNWKPNMAPPITLGWLYAISKGHKELKKPFSVSEPVLVMHSDKTSTDVTDTEQTQNSDMVLSVEDIDRISRNIIGSVKTAVINNGIHDLILSKESVRMEVYATIFKWLRATR